MPLIMLALALAFPAASAFAQQQPTPQEQAACRSDAMRFCSSSVGKPPEMRACLAQNKANLSAACRAVVDGRGG